MRHAHFIAGIALVAATVLSGCRSEQVAQNDTANGNSNTNTDHYVTVPSGTSIEVTLGTALTSETASVGSTWSGSTRSASNLIPAGSLVAGTVTAVKPARKGDRAMLDLGLSSVTVAGHKYPVSGSTEAVVAGSTRKRNVGAIAGSALGGALIGKAVSGSNKGAVIGGVVGGGVATGVVAASDGFQVTLKEGTAITFITNEALAVRP